VGLKATALSKQDNYIASIKNVETQKELDNQRQKLQDLVQAIKVDRDN
jgi:cell division FtsZ-interacting protein ZapD